MKFFISAIGTDSGKTLISAIFARAFDAAYWKPVQAGAPHDSAFIRSLGIHAIPEKYVLATPESPHAAAAREGVNISLSDFTLPDSNHLVVEGAGGLMVPINNSEMMVDLAQKLEIPIVLVCNLYLGSINHSLLSLELLKSRRAKVAGIVFNGESNSESEKVIELHSSWPVLLRVPPLSKISIHTIDTLADQLKKTFSSL